MGWGERPNVMARLRKSRKFIGSGHHANPLEAGQGGGADLFAIELGQLFAHRAPLEVEIGSGKGDFILARAQQFPQRNFLAIELAGSVYQWLAIRAARSQLDNLCALRADARPVVNLMLPAASASVFHIYFPDPWPKNRHSKHRLFSHSLIDGLACCLEPDGRIFVATDVGWYFEHIAGLFALRGFQFAREGVGGAERTNFGRRFAAAGTAIHAGCFQLRNASHALSHGSAQVAADV
jgi:tRNA (guanine-N7-)-methyltransferase